MENNQSKQQDQATKPIIVDKTKDEAAKTATTAPVKPPEAAKGGNA